MRIKLRFVKYEISKEIRIRLILLWIVLFLFWVYALVYAFVDVQNRGVLLWN
jgi:hypothetical protein